MQPASPFFHLSLEISIVMLFLDDGVLCNMILKNVKQMNIYKQLKWLNQGGNKVITDF